MIKDRKINYLIKKLKSEIDFSGIEIVDYWDADLFAIGLKKANKLVYISIFNCQNEKAPRYDYDFELIHASETQVPNVVIEKRNVLALELIADIKNYLNA